jgi:hypothetical protein
MWAFVVFNGVNPHWDRIGCQADIRIEPRTYFPAGKRVNQ